MLTLYKISKQGDNNFYIGSTEDFNRRKIEHKYRCKTKDFKLYKYIRENGGWSSWNMEIIGGCGSVAGEIKCIKKMKPPLNTLIYNDRKQYQRQYIKYHYQKNKEYQKEYHKEYNKYKYSWGGDMRSNNNLLNINPSLFH